ncbi:GIY-YIG nuclease family protein [Candidatus Saccharibacteria bacterium]|nr:GIY-YIG nuclease family protein [Candidatus Saccharibacteria bacterium]
MGKVELIKEATKTHDPRPRVRRFHDEEIVFCFIPYYNDWLLVNAYKVVNSNKHLIDVDEDYTSHYKSLLGRLVLMGNAKTKLRNIRMNNRDSIDALEIRELLPEPYYKTGKKFPGYENVNLTWRELKAYIDRPGWHEALNNQKAIYLITDISNGKHYVGKASGKDMLYNRWKNYIDTLHGGNEGLKKLTEHHIKNNFTYSILEIFKSTTLDSKITEREEWWKNALKTKEFGYNEN